MVGAPFPRDEIFLLKFFHPSLVFLCTTYGIFVPNNVGALPDFKIIQEIACIPPLGRDVS